MKCPLFSICNCKLAPCNTLEPDESCFWYRYFKKRIQEVEYEKRLEKIDYYKAAKTAYCQLGDQWDCRSCDLIEYFEHNNCDPAKCRAFLIQKLVWELERYKDKEEEDGRTKTDN